MAFLADLFFSPAAFLIAVVSFLAVTTYSLIIASIPFLKQYNCFAIPNDSSNHKGKIPHGAGGIIVLVLVSALLVGKFFPIPWLPYLYPTLDTTYSFSSLILLTNDIAHSFSFLLLLLVLSFSSFTDDIKPKGVVYRLAVQIIAALLITKALPGDILLGYAPFWLDRLFAFLFIVTFTNFFNFMDGSDGMSAVQTIAIAFGLTAVTFVSKDLYFFIEIGFPAMLLMATAIGFLFCNWHPAKIFLGDAGSVPIGFFLACLILLCSSYGYWEASVILPMYYYCDAGLTLLLRIVRREKWWKPHKKHFYKIALQKGRSHDSIAKAVAIANSCLVLLTLWAVQNNRMLYEISSIALAGGVVVLLLLWMRATPKKATAKK